MVLHWAASMPFGIGPVLRMSHEHRGCRNVSVGGLGESLDLLSEPLCGGGPCSAPIRSSSRQQGGSKFLVLMQHGRVGSTWLELLLRNHSNSTVVGEDLGGACCHSVAESAERYHRFYEDLDESVSAKITDPKLGSPQSLHDSMSIGAMQKWNRFNDIARVIRGNASFTRLERTLDRARIVCLARPNPAEAYSSNVIGDAHQRTCGDHIVVSDGTQAPCEFTARRPESPGPPLPCVSVRWRLSRRPRSTRPRRSTPAVSRLISDSRARSARSARPGPQGSPSFGFSTRTFDATRRPCRAS